MSVRFVGRGRAGVCGGGIIGGGRSKCAQWSNNAIMMKLSSIYEQFMLHINMTFSEF